MSNLITQDLIAACDWLKKAPSHWKYKAYQDLKNKLGRVKGEMHPSALAGIKLEKTLNTVLSNCTNFDNLKCSPAFRELISSCQNYEQQRKTKSFMVIDNIEYCLYGKMDYYKKDHIIDLKSTFNYKGSKKYLNSYQHIIYCYNEKIDYFSYLVAEFESEESTKIKNIHRIDYIEKDFEKLRSIIEDKIIEIINFLKIDEELYELYENTYSLY